MCRTSFRNHYFSSRHCPKVVSYRSWLLNMKPSLLLLVLSFPFSLHAAVLERDWLTPGDGLLTYDTVTGREWLDLPVTLLSQYTDLNTARDKLDIIDGSPMLCLY